MVAPLPVPPPDDVLALLRRMDVLADFSPEQLRWVAGHGELVGAAAGVVVVREGDRDGGFHFLSSGSIAISRTEDGAEVQSATTDHVGSWMGRIPLTGEPCPITVRTLTEATFWRMTGEDADAMVAGGMPFGKHIIQGIQLGSRRFEARLRERERLASLGRLSAGLAHELNNPAGAVRRAAAQLRGVLAEQGRLAVCLRAEPPVLERLAAVQAELAAPADPERTLSALDRADTEEALADLLSSWGAEDPDGAAAVLVDGGASAGWLASRLGDVDPSVLPSVVGVLVAATNGAQLAGEIEAASARISELVGAVKSYSNMDGATQADVDVRVGLASTVTMLKHLLRGVTVVQDYDQDLPTVPGNPGELNQVWTNLVDNAADAMGGAGTVTLRARADGDGVCVEVADDGPGMPAEVRDRVFDPFFTTKGVGEGTGMGLDFVWRIVVERHGGTVSVDSEPGRGTTLRVLLPRAAPAAAG